MVQLTVHEIYEQSYDAATSLHVPFDIFTSKLWALWLFHLCQVYYYFPFSALADTAKLYNDLRWNITRPEGFEAVMRVRCSQVCSPVFGSSFASLVGEVPYLIYGKWNWARMLTVFYLFAGNSSSGVRWQLLQKNSNRCWSTCGLSLYHIPSPKHTHRQLCISQAWSRTTT